MSHVVVNGPASWNTVVRLADLPEPSPHTVAATGYHDGLGGTSAGKAVTLAALGLPTTLVTTLGDDEAATRVLCALRAGRHGDRLRVVARHAVAGGTERHVNLVSDDGERVSLYLEQPTAPPPGNNSRRTDSPIRTTLAALRSSSGWNWRPSATTQLRAMR